MSSDHDASQYQFSEDIYSNSSSREDGASIKRSTTPSSIISRPSSSRGVNFSRPTTLYQLDSPSSPVSDNRLTKTFTNTSNQSFYHSEEPAGDSINMSPQKKKSSISSGSGGSPVRSQPHPQILTTGDNTNELPPTVLRPPTRNASSSNNSSRQSSLTDSTRRLSFQPPENLPPRRSSLYHDQHNNSSNTSELPPPNSNVKLDRHKSMAPTPANQPSSAPGNRKPAKICRKCGEPISGQFVRALNSAYHINCFTCADCGTLCSSKFFPIDAPEEMQQMGIMQIPLCEKDYFKRLELLCYVCEGALRGSYITALGRKYHVEHFTCSMCSTVFGPEDSYYEYQDAIYCHFHYSTLFASKCEGCQTSILKQFVEIYRSGREQQWHPECYMIFKFWNVKLSPEGSLPSINPLRPLSPSVQKPLDGLTREDVQGQEQEVDKKVFRIWTVLCGFEEASAAFISDMLQTASASRFIDSLSATMKLVAKIEVLFVAVDSVCALIEPTIREETDRDGEPTTYTKLGKEAKTLCKKVVGFMSLLSKAREKSVKRMGITQELLNLVTSLAHYLKLLIRYGLSNTLQYDRQHLESHAVDDFLDQIESHEKTTLSGDPLAKLGVNAMTTDHCNECDRSIEDRCARIGDRRWHLKCLKCCQCGIDLGIHPEDDLKVNLDEARWSHSKKKVFCSLCAPPDGRAGFILVPKLRQFVFLLKIAVARLQLVLNAFDTRDKKTSGAPAIATEGSSSSSTKPDAIKNQSQQDSEASSEMSQSESGYMTTLTDIRRLRSTKLDQQVSESSRKARRSKILDMPDSEKAQMRENDSTQSLHKTLDKDGASQQQQQQTPRKLTIQDEKQSQDDYRLDRTTDLFKNEKSLTLDDIPRIVAAEQARELRPNAYRHQARTGSSEKTPEPRDVSTGSRKDQQTKKYLSELTNVEAFSVRHIAVLLMEKMLNGWFTLDELLDLIEVKKTPSIWEKVGKAFGGGGGGSSDKKDKNRKKSGVFGVPLDALVEKYGVDSTLGVGPGPLRIPAFVDDCISSMRQKDMSVEGVFRKNGNIRRLKEFSEKIDKQPDKGGILSEESPVQLAALLKKFLRELPEPLMTSKLLKLWIAAQSKFFLLLFHIIHQNHTVIQGVPVWTSD